MYSFLLYASPAICRKCHYTWSRSPPSRERRKDRTFSEHHSQLKISIKDNGIGRQAASQRSDATRDQRKSTALAVIQERVDLRRAEGQETSHPQFNDLVDADGKSAGTEVWFTIPMDLM